MNNCSITSGSVDNQGITKNIFIAHQLFFAFYEILQLSILSTIIGYFYDWHLGQLHFWCRLILSFPLLFLLECKPSLPNTYIIFTGLTWRLHYNLWTLSYYHSNNITQAIRYTDLIMSDVVIIIFSKVKSNK